jgi:hypothetical protein
MGSPLKMNTYMLDGLQVCDIDMNYMIDLPTIYTKDNMPVSSIHIPTSDELLKWPHLNGVRIPAVPPNCRMIDSVQNETLLPVSKNA